MKKSLKRTTSVLLVVLMVVALVVIPTRATSTGGTEDQNLSTFEGIDEVPAEGETFVGIDEESPESITLDRTSLDLEKGEEQALLGAITSSDDANGEIFWSTSDSSVATVDSNGVVAGVEEGTAVITAETAGGSLETCAVTVTSPIEPTEPVFEPAAMPIVPAVEPEEPATEPATLPIEPAVEPEEPAAEPATLPIEPAVEPTAEPEFEPEEESTISDSELSEAPEAASPREYSPYYSPSPTVYPSSVSLNKTSLTLGRYAGETLVATILPSNTTERTLTWTTSNSSVAVVTSTGVVTGINAGSALITAKTSNGLVATCSVTVTGTAATADDYGNNFGDAYGWELRAGAIHTRTGTIETNGDWDYFWFTAPTTGSYSFYTTGNTDTMGYLYDSSQRQLAYNDDSTDRNFRITYDLTAGQKYYVAIRAYSSNTGAYTFGIVTPHAITDDYGNSFGDAYGWELREGMIHTRSGTIETNGDWDYFWFTAPVTGNYSIYTTGSTDTIGYLYDSSQRQIAYNDNDTDRNFKITYNVTAGQKYYVAIRASGTTTGEYKFTIVVPHRITDDYGNDFGDAYGWALREGMIHTRSGTIETNGDWDYFWFTAPVTGSYSIYTTGSTDTMGYLYDSSQRQIAYNDDSTDRNFRITHNLTAGQKYYVAIRAYGSNTGAYVFGITVPYAIVDDYGNDFGNAYGWELREGAIHTRGGTIETSGDWDYFWFTAPSTGSYSIYTTGSTDTMGYLYDSSQRQIAYNDNDTDRNFKITYNLTAGQKYYVAIRAAGTSTGEYRFSIVVPYTITDDYGNDFNNAYGWALREGAIHTRSGTIETIGDWDYFWFTAPSTGSYSIYTTGNTDTMGYLYDSSQRQLAYNDDSTDRNFRITYNLTAGQKYYVAIRAYGSNTGAYTFGIVTPHTITDDYGSSFADAYGWELRAGMIYSRTGTIETSGDWDYFWFTAPSTGSYSFYTTGNTDTMGYLYDSSQRQLAYNDDSTDRNFRITYNLTAGQKYYVAIRAYGSNTGAYTFAISTPHAASADDYGNDFNDAYGWSLSAGMTYTRSGAIETNGDWDYFWFTAPTSGTYTIYTTGSTDTMGYLYNSSRSMLAYNDDSTDRNFRITYNLTAGQRYYVAIRAYGSNTGNYIFGISVPR